MQDLLIDLLRRHGVIHSGIQLKEQNTPRINGVPTRPVREREAQDVIILKDYWL